MRLRYQVALAATLIALACGTNSHAQEKAKESKRAANPAFAPVTDDPKLPRVLLIGDSISIGYTLPVRELLAGEANVHRAQSNCGPTSRGVENINQWLGDGKWDVIHFNFGIHDTVYMDASGKRQKPGTGQHQVPIEQYEKNLRTLVARMKATGAKVIFATTTPIPEGTSTSIAGDEVTYNRAATQIMQNEGVAIDDLHAFAATRMSELQLPMNVHFTEQGSKQLGVQVAAAIEKALAK